MDAFSIHWVSESTPVSELLSSASTRPVCYSIPHGDSAYNVTPLTFVSGRTPPYKQSHISIYDYLSKDELQWNESTIPSSSSLITSIHCQVPAIPGIDPHHLLPICDDLGDIQQCWHPDCMEQELFLDRDDVPALRWHFLGDVALHGEVREACDKNLPIPCIHSSEDGVHCGKEFVSAEWFLQHVQRHLAAPRATCPLCGVELESPGGIVEHYWNWPTTRCPVFWRMLRDGHGVEKVMLSESLGPGPPKGYPRWLS